MNGDPIAPRLEALEKLYAKHGGEVFRFALRLSGDRDDAEDLAAEAFAQAACRPDMFRGDSSPKTWLCGIVINRFRMLRRKARTQRDAAQAVRRTAETIPEDG